MRLLVVILYRTLITFNPTPSFTCLVAPARVVPCNYHQPEPKDVEVVGGPHSRDGFGRGQEAEERGAIGDKDGSHRNREKLRRGGELGEGMKVGSGESESRENSRAVVVARREGRTCGREEVDANEEGGDGLIR